MDSKIYNPAYIFRIIALFVAYFVAAKIGLELAYSSKQITLVWPPAGIALAAVLLRGYAMWPGIFLGAFAINFLTSGIFLSSLGIATGNTSAALIGAFLLRKIKGFDRSFVKVSDYLWFILLGAAISTLASAFTGVSSLALSHSISIASPGDFFSFFGLWWFGDAMGVIIFTPVLLVWPHILEIKKNKRFPELAALVFFCILASLFVFTPTTHYFIVILLPLTLWATVRFHQSGVTFMTLFLLAVSINGTTGGFGLFSHIGSPEENLLFAQAFLGIISIVSMVVALSVFERKKSVEEWKKLSLLLHDKIADQAESLALRAQELQEYINHMSIFTAKIAPDGSILAASSSSKKASGVSQKKLAKTNFLEGPWWSFDPEVHARVREAFQKALTGKTIRYDEQILAFGTTHIWIDFRLTPVSRKGNGVDFVIAEGLDITKRKELERQLAQAYHELEEKVGERTKELNNANNALKEEVLLRDRFLATLSHELRNPLSPIISAVEIIRLMDIKDDELQKLFDIIDRQANQMARLLKDLLDVSRVSHQKIDLDMSSMDIKDVIQAAVETASPLFLKREHDLSVSFPEDRLIVRGDPMRIEQIIVNLLNNAAKYTQAGGKISLRARNENGYAVVIVEDNGIGISPEMMPKVFNLFSQDKNSLSMAKGGLGIGLALAKALAELHGGAITASSDGTGKGATFELRIPLLMRDE